MASHPCGCEPGGNAEEQTLRYHQEQMRQMALDLYVKSFEAPDDDASALAGLAMIEVIFHWLDSRPTLDESMAAALERLRAALPTPEEMERWGYSLRDLNEARADVRWPGRRFRHLSSLCPNRQ